MHLPRLFNLGIDVTLNAWCRWNKWNIWATERLALLAAPASAPGGTGWSTRDSPGKGNYEEKCPGAEAVTKNIILGLIWNIATSIKTKETLKRNRKSSGNCHSLLFYLDFYCFKMYSQCQRLEEKTRIRRILFLTILIFSLSKFTPGERNYLANVPTWKCRRIFLIS